MTTRITWAEVAPAITFRAPIDLDLRLTDVRLANRRVDGRIDRVIVRFTVDWPCWERIDAAGWFGLTADVRRPPGRLSQRGDPVEIEAELTQHSATVLQIVANDVTEAAAWLRDAPPTDPTRSEASWMARTALQADPKFAGLKAGFSTVHFLQGDLR